MPIFTKPKIDPDFTKLDKKLDEILDSGISPLPSCYDSKGQTKEEYFSKLEFPKWYCKNYVWADWVAIGVAILGLGIVMYCAYGNVLAYL